MALPDCREATVHIFQTADGRWFERFVLPNTFFDNEIESPNDATRTIPAQVFYNRGECSVPSHPLEESPVLVSRNPAEVSTANIAAANVASTFFLAALVSGCWFLWKRSRSQLGANNNYHPHSDLPTLPRLSDLAGLVATSSDDDGEESEGDDEEEEPEFVSIQPPESDGIQSNSEPNSADRVPTYEEHYGTATAWPPKDMGGMYDPTRPEERNEFEDYLRILDQHGFSPSGNDVIKVLWGATPGGSKRYKAAVKRRDQFVRRLNYYRSEGA